MKKNIFARTIGLWLCLFIVSLVLPAKNVAAEQTVATENAEYVFNEEFTLTQDLTDLDWRNCSDEAVSHAVLMKDWYEIGAWLDAMSQEDREELLARNTDLLSQAVIRPAEMADESGTVSEENVIRSTVYEYSLAYYRNMIRMRASYPAKSSGYWTVHITNAATGQTCTLKIKISGIDKDTKITESQTYTLSEIWSGTNWCSMTCDENEGALYKTVSSSIYSTARVRFTYKKPAGYTVSTSYTNGATDCLYKIYWNPEFFGENQSCYFNLDTKEMTDSNNRRIYTDHVSMTAYDASSYTGTLSLMSIVNVFKNAGIGSEGTTNITGANLVQTILLTPVSYNVNYNGNGATGGSVAAQNCSYEKTYTTQGNGFHRTYTVTYNGNGGTPAVSTQTASYVFKGWGVNQATTVNYAAGASYKNLAVTGGGVVTMYAVWSPVAVKLPAAVRTGYRFDGWNIGKEGTAYTPKSDVTASALWTANTYRILLNADGGVFDKDIDFEENDVDSEKESISATYDTDVELPVPVREGYTFAGWTGAGGAYTDMARNLTAERNASVNLTANWEAKTDTPYTVNRYKQVAAGSAQYELFDPGDGDPVKGTEILYGTTDATVTVPAISVGNYVTPDARMVRIAGDGSTVVDFYYDLEAEAGGNSGTEAGTIVKGTDTGLTFRIDVSGAEYEVMQNADGTLGIKMIEAATSKVTIPDAVTVNGKVYRITEIYDKAFYNNAGIKEVKLSANISRIGKSAFEGCKNLRKVTLGKGVVSIGDKAFKGCTQLKSIKLPAETQVVGNSAFYGCSSLNKVTLNTGLLKIGNKAFYGCKVLTKIKIPKTVLKMGSYVFKKCTKMKKVTFAGGSQLLSMGKGIFSCCGALRKITLPSKLTSVPAKAFYNCKKLKKVTIRSKNLTGVGAKAFKKCGSGIKFVVPIAKIRAYKKILKGKY